MIKSYPKPLVFCDVETTGSRKYGARVTDVAFVRFENGKEVDRFETLVNPEIPIPYNIQQITGINDTMVKDAPVFNDIAERIYQICDGATFVAHNVKFDWSFIHGQLKTSGFDLKCDKICTVLLSRRLFPYERGHSLSAIIERYDFHCSARHRAMGDTEVMVQFAHYIDEHIDPELLEQALSGARPKVSLPPNITQKQVDVLPKNPGVYSFFAENGELLYVGKSINIYKRVLSHFTNANYDRKAKKVWEQVHEIDTITTASDLGACLLELYKIKTESPLYNRKSRRVKRLWFIELEPNEDGYLTVQLKSSNDISIDKLPEIRGIFRSSMRAKQFLARAAKEQKLCPKLMGAEKNSAGPCFSSQLHICSGACSKKPDVKEYNRAVEKVFETRRLRAWPYEGPKEIIKNNPELGISERFVVDNWILQKAEVVEFDEPYDLFPVGDLSFDYEMYKVLVGHLAKKY